MSRGYFGIGVYHIKNNLNLGTLWRSAYNFNAQCIFTIGKRYEKQCSDTTKAHRHIPLINYQDWEDFKKHIPFGCRLVFIEQCEGATNLKDFNHPQQALYILGAEDYGIPLEIMRGFSKVFIDTPRCLNVSVAGSIIMYDRSVKLK